MKIEVGKKYRTRNGQTVEITSIDHPAAIGRFLSGHESRWRTNGRWDVTTNHPLDLVEEVPSDGLQIEVGKKYRTRDGRIAEITYISRDQSTVYPFKGLIGDEHFSWTRHGRLTLRERGPDLISPVEWEAAGNVEVELELEWDLGDAFRKTMVKELANIVDSVPGYQSAVILELLKRDKEVLQVISDVLRASEKSPLSCIEALQRRGPTG